VDVDASDSDDTEPLVTSTVTPLAKRKLTFAGTTTTLAAPTSVEGKRLKGAEKR
jgi:hypothetical protein